MSTVSEPPGFTIMAGLPANQRGAAAALFWAAFREKLLPVMRPEQKALAFIESVLDPDHGLSALAPNGAVIGIAGFKTASGAFVGGNLADLRKVYGLPGALCRGVLLSLLERPLEPGVLLMDGIAVAASARGQGVGTALLDALKQHARQLGCASIRLDVIDTNPRARALYERNGFAARETAGMGPLRHIFGFRRATTMSCAL